MKGTLENKTGGLAIANKNRARARECEVLHCTHNFVSFKPKFPPTHCTTCIKFVCIHLFFVLQFFLSFPQMFMPISVYTQPSDFTQSAEQIWLRCCYHSHSCHTRTHSHKRTHTYAKTHNYAHTCTQLGNITQSAKQIGFTVLFYHSYSCHTQTHAHIYIHMYTCTGLLR